MESTVFAFPAFRRPALNGKRAHASRKLTGPHATKRRSAPLYLVSTVNHHHAKEFPWLVRALERRRTLAATMPPVPRCARVCAMAFVMCPAGCVLHGRRW